MTVWVKPSHGDCVEPKEILWNDAAISFYERRFLLNVYTTPESLYCAKLRVLLRHKQTQWHEISPAGGCGDAGYLEIVPAGTMPAIVDGSFSLADSEAIAEYLNETIIEPAMLPDAAAARARCRERSRFHDTRLEPELRKLFSQIGEAGRDSQIVRLQGKILNQRLDELSRLLVSDASLDTRHLTLGDCGFPISFAWIDAFTPVLGLTLDWPPAVILYRTQIGIHPAVREELDAYSAPIRAWMQSKFTAESTKGVND